MRSLFFGALVAIIAAGCATYYVEASDRGATPSGNFDGTHFVNPIPPTNRDFTDLLRWRFTRDPADWPARIVSHDTVVKPPARVNGPDVLVTMIGHSTVLLQTDGLNILTDPIWSDRASPFSFIGPKRVRAPGVSFENLPKIDVIVVSHDHYDHMDIPTLKMLWDRDHPQIVVPLGNDAILKDDIKGIAATALDWGKSVDVGHDVHVTATPAQHWSQRGLFDRDKALWSGFLIDAPGGAIFFAGDTGYGDWWIDEVAKMAPKIRLAILPIGAYEPRWFMAYAHSNPDEAVRIFQRLKADAALGVHWGTFPLADEGPDQPVVDLAAARTAYGVPADTFRALKPGETWDVAPD